MMMMIVERCHKERYTIQTRPSLETTHRVRPTEDLVERCHKKCYMVLTRPSSVRLANMMILQLLSCHAMCHRSDDVALLGPDMIHPHRATHTHHLVGTWHDTPTKQLINKSCN